MTDFDLSEIKSPKGLLKLFQALINLLGAIFCFVSWWSSWRLWFRFFIFVSMTGFILDLVLLAMAFVRISPQIKFMPYIEIALDGLWILFYLIASSILIKWIRLDGLLGVSVFCGYVAMITYFFDALLVYKKLRSPSSTQPDGGEPAGAWTTDVPPPKY